MIKVLKLSGLALTLALLVAAAALAKGDTRCERCGMSWDASPTSLTVTLKGNKSAHYFESMACLVQSFTRDKVVSARVVDYNSKDRALIDATSAHYLYDTERIPHSMPPFIAAFSSKKAALAAQKDLGGEYATFDQVWSKLAKHFSKGGR
jgi:nitrous oxide reductase accessory protein NosL